MSSKNDPRPHLTRARLDPFRAYGAVWEEEPDASGALAPTAVVFLTNRECPFRCVMCDLWVHTLEERVPPGAIAMQIRHAVAALPPARHIKLYNAGSFFDPNAIPPEDDDAIACALQEYERVIVEAHPAFLTGTHGERCLRFRDRLNGRLEVAIGLETAHEAVLARLNKGMTLDSFARAANFLADHDIDLRAFILLKPPSMDEEEGVEWACGSIDVAAACGAIVCSVIPTRAGTDAMARLDPSFVPPSLRSLERAVEYGLSTADASPAVCTRGVAHNGSRRRVVADLWDIERFFTCACSTARAARLRAMNLTQKVLPAIACDDC